VYGSVVGLAFLDEGGEIRFTTNPSDLRALAECFDSMAQHVRAEHEGDPHVHLEPVFMNGMLNIEDIVFEKADD
jgi:hypothetical protein